MSDFETIVLSDTPSLEPIGSGKYDAQLVRFKRSPERGVLKFAQFTTDTTRGVPKNTMHRREVAAYHLDRDVLHFHIVPEAMLVRLDGREASISRYVDGILANQVVPEVFDKTQHDWKQKVALLWSKTPLDEAVLIVLFDLITNNTDRHAKNWLFTPNDRRLHAIDNGLCFGKQFRFYRSVLHKYLFFRNLKVPPEVERKLRSITLNQIKASLAGLLTAREVFETWQRLQFVTARINHLDFHTIAQGLYGKNDFPSYVRYFKPQSVGVDPILLPELPASLA